MLMPTARYANAPTEILHHYQQDLKNRVSLRKIWTFRFSYLQEARFLALVQDLSLPLMEQYWLGILLTQSLFLV